MNSLLTLLQLIVIVLCVWGELSSRIRTTLAGSIGLACLALSALIGLTARPHPHPLLEALVWLSIALLVVLYLRTRWRHDRRHHDRRRQPWNTAR